MQTRTTLFSGGTHPLAVSRSLTLPLDSCHPEAKQPGTAETGNFGRDLTEGGDAGVMEARRGGDVVPAPAGMITGSAEYTDSTMKRKTLAIVLGITGGVMLLGGGWGFVTSPHGLHARSASVGGTVIEDTGRVWVSRRNEHGGIDGYTNATVIVEFFVDGKRYTVSGEVRETREMPASKMKGLSVPVSYEPRNPTNSVIGEGPDQSARDSPWVIVLSIGAVLILVSGCMLLRSRSWPIVQAQKPIPDKG